MSRAGGSRTARIVFWASAGLIAGSYVGFPALLLARGALRPRPLRPRPAAAGPGPSVTVIVAAHDEAASIGARMDDLLAQRVPGPLEIVVASDGSTDGTAAIVAGYADRGVRLLDLPRVGKADALNAAVAASSGDILVFTDANSRFAPGAIEALLAPLADPEVGGVAGDQRYVKGGVEDGLAQGERGYWDLDRALKIAESAAGNVVSATGAIYAIRRQLFRPVISGVTDDFITSVAVVAQGRRLVFAPDAVAFEPPARSGGDEFGRKVRIMTRGLRGIIAARALLDPRRHGFYAVQLAWHKVVRRLVVFPLIGLFASSLALAGRGPLYALATLAQLGGYGLGVAGLLSRGRPAGRSRVLAFPAYFMLVNAAALKAVVDIARGRRIDRWDPVRAAGDAPGATDAGPSATPAPTTNGAADHGLTGTVRLDARALDGTVPATSDDPDPDRPTEPHGAPIR